MSRYRTRHPPESLGAGSEACRGRGGQPRCVVGVGGREPLPLPGSPAVRSARSRRALPALPAWAAGSVRGLGAAAARGAPAPRRDVATGGACWPPAPVSPRRALERPLLHLSWN